MSRHDDLTAINCTACGAGLDILGGGRVVVHICPYCGTELNALDGYRALRQYSDLKRPDTPFQLGMTGKIHDVDYTVIGTLEHEESWHGQTWRWVDHQLYSPTHGYAWLSIEDGHLIFTRRYRRPGWMSEKLVEIAEHRPTYRDKGSLYSYYETSTSTIVFAEGEFTWAPRIGQSSTAVTALSGDAMVSFSESGTEREIHRSTYLDKDQVAAGFGLSLDLRPRKTHPVQPFKAGPHAAFLAKTGMLCAAICVALALVFVSLPKEKALPTQQIAAQDLPVEIRFDIQTTNRLAKIFLQSDVRNSWAYLEMELSDPDDVPLFEAGRTVEYYTGRSSDGDWDEGSTSTTLRFRPSVPGTYTLYLDAPESDFWTDPVNPSFSFHNSAPISDLRVTVSAGLSTGVWLIWLAGGFFLFSALTRVRRFLHNRARWAGSDWTDED